MDECLAALESVLGSLVPALCRFNAGVGDGDLAAAEEQFGLELPADYEALYRWRDGESDDAAAGIFFGYHFRSLSYNVQMWSIWRDVLREDPSINANVVRTSAPKGFAREEYINLRRIPFGDDGANDLLGVDLDPGPDGQVGQVIRYGRGHDQVQVFAPSVSVFISTLVEMLREHGEARTTAEGVPYVAIGAGAPEPWFTTFRSA